MCNTIIWHVPRVHTPYQKRRRVECSQKDLALGDENDGTGRCEILDQFVTQLWSVKHWFDIISVSLSRNPCKLICVPGCFWFCLQRSSMRPVGQETRGYCFLDKEGFRLIYYKHPLIITAYGLLHFLIVSKTLWGWESKQKITIKLWWHPPYSPNIAPGD